MEEHPSSHSPIVSSTISGACTRECVYGTLDSSCDSSTRPTDRPTEDTRRQLQKIRARSAVRVASVSPSLSTNVARPARALPSSDGTITCSYLCRIVNARTNDRTNERASEPEPVCGSRSTRARIAALCGRGKKKNRVCFFSRYDSSSRRRGERAPACKRDMDKGTIILIRPPESLQGEAAAMPRGKGVVEPVTRVHRTEQHQQSSNI